MSESTNAVTLGQVRADVLKVLDRYSLNGIPNPKGQGAGADLHARLTGALNTARRRVFAACHAGTAHLTLWVHRPANLARRDGHVYRASGARSVTFQVLGQACVTLSDGEGRVLFEQQAFGDPLRYRVCRLSLAEEDAAAELTLTFSGPAPFCERHVAFYQEAYPNEEDIPLPGGVCRFSLPEEFLRVRSLLKDGRPWEHYAVEGRQLLLPAACTGEYVLLYDGLPPALPENAPDSTPWDVEPRLTDAIVLSAAYDLCDPAEAGLADRLANRYTEAMVNLMPPAEAARVRQRYY